jgi:hypothetical protein
MIKMLKHISVLSIAAAVFALVSNASAETLSGYLDENTQTRTHSITLPSDGTLQLSVTIDQSLSLAISTYYGITIFDSDGTTMLQGFSGPTGGTDTDGIYGPFALKAGPYQIRFARWTGSGSYTVAAAHTPQPLAGDNEPDNTVAQAQAAALNSSITGHLGYIGGGGGTAPDELDWWIFSIPSDGEVRVAVSIDSTLSLATSLYHGITIFDSNGTTQLEGFSVDTGSTAGDFGPFPLKAGNYYLRVARAYGYGGYSMQLTSDTISTITTTTAPPASTTSTTIIDGQGADLLNLAEWDVYGSASADTNELIFGDSIGSDPQDQDHDGNPENTWMKGSAGAGPGDDYDWIVSKKEFSPPLTLTWSGCFPTTAYGYQYAAIASKNTAFTGAAGSGQSVIDWNNMLAFHTSWEHAGALLSFTRKAGQNTINTVPGATPGGHGICGEFKIVWENNKATYYFNDALVEQQDAAYFGPVRIFFRSYENPFSIDSITVLSASPNTTTTAAPVTSTTTAPETTTTTSISSVTTTIATPCPIQRTLSTREDVDALRLLRDIRFMNTTGIFITHIYYKNSAGISAILEEHPELQQQMKALVADNISVARELVNKGAAAISPGAVDDITRFLENLRQNSSPGLQADIQLIINGIKNRKLVEGIGVKVK